jgi:hypothetical protein
MPCIATMSIDIMNIEPINTPLAKTCQENFEQKILSPPVNMIFVRRRIAPFDEVERHGLGGSVFNAALPFLFPGMVHAPVFFLTGQTEAVNMLSKSIDIVAYLRCAMGANDYDNFIV